MMPHALHALTSNLLHVDASTHQANLCTHACMACQGYCEQHGLDLCGRLTSCASRSVAHRCTSLSSTTSGAPVTAQRPQGICTLAFNQDTHVSHASSAFMSPLQDTMYNRLHNDDSVLVSWYKGISVQWLKHTRLLVLCERL